MSLRCSIIGEIEATLFKFPVGILYNFADTGGTNVANFYQ
jgi:hypothetical protein